MFVCIPVYLVYNCKQRQCITSNTTGHAHMKAIYTSSLIAHNCSSVCLKRLKHVHEQRDIYSQQLSWANHYSVDAVHKQLILCISQYLVHYWEQHDYLNIYSNRMTRQIQWPLSREDGVIVLFSNNTWYEYRKNYVSTCKLHQWIDH